MDTITSPVVFGEVLFDCFPDGSAVLGGAPFNVAWHLHGMRQRQGLRPGIRRGELRGAGQPGTHQPARAG